MEKIVVESMNSYSSLKFSQKASSATGHIMPFTARKFFVVKRQEHIGQICLFLNIILFG